MYEDGLYISHGPENRALAVIREDGGKTLWSQYPRQSRGLDFVSRSKRLERGR
jgi:hypothetical protein